MENAPHLRCDGWWEQPGFGRQAMHELRLHFADGQIEGSGTDIVGPFTFAGDISATGNVILIKQYLGRHRVNYVGKYDGEGLLWGDWNIGPMMGPWLIRLAAGCRSNVAEIEVLSPVD